MNTLLILNRADRIRNDEGDITEGEALYQAIWEHDAELLRKVLNASCDPRKNVENCLDFLDEVFAIRNWANQTLDSIKNDE